MKSLTITGAFSALLLFSGKPMLSQQTPYFGQWLVDPGPGGASPEKVHLKLVRNEEGVSTGFYTPLQQLRGLSAGELSSQGTVVRFEMRRDAGSFSMEGWSKEGHGAGTYGFTADPGFADELERRGIGRPTPHDQFVLALHDVGLALVDELAAQGYGRPTVRELVQAATQGVKLDYVRGLGELGYRLGSMRALMDVQNQAVTPQFIRELAEVGYRGLPMHDLLSLQNHGITASLVRELGALGYGNVSVMELVELRSHAITPQFIRSVNQGRARRRTVGELVSLRVTGERG